MCSSSTGMPIRCSLVATSRRVRWLLLVRNRNGMSQSRSMPNELDGAGNQLAAAVDDAVHVDQKSFFHGNLLVRIRLQIDSFPRSAWERKTATLRVALCRLRWVQIGVRQKAGLIAAERRGIVFPRRAWEQGVR